MMYCTYCGKQIEDDSKFCTYCGNSTGYVEKKEVNNNVKEKIFAFIGFGLGIAAFVIGLIPFACFSAIFMAIPGMIFSKIGMNSNKKSFAKKGRIFSVLGLIFGIIMSVLTVVIIVVLVEETGGYEFLYY